LQERFDEGFRLADLKELHRSLQRSLIVTEPKPVAVPNPDEALAGLFRAYVAARSGGQRALTKPVVLDRVVAQLRRHGVRARRGAYIDDFIFDVVIEETGDRPPVLGVLLFAAPRKDWTPIERDAGHFLYALRRLDIPGRAVVQPPPPGNGAAQSYDRVLRWLNDERVQVVELDQLVDTQLVLELTHA
jgi:hypothetical protein